VIRTFRHKGLAELFETGRSAKVDAKLHRRLLIRLDRLNAARRPEEMNLPGFDFHALRGFDPVRFTVHINGPWCVTFVFDGEDAVGVDLVQYH
jgi:proteic killer suppression protein